MSGVSIRWKFIQSDRDLVHRVEQEFSVPEIYARVLVGRGITSRDRGIPFFNPDPAQLHDPFLLKDMEAYVERVIAQVSANLPIIIFGDYDVDGTTGDSMIYLFFKSIGSSAPT